MNSEEKSNKYWSKIVTTENLVKEYIAKAKEDLKASEVLFKSKDYDWSFSISYNAILQASRALMAHNKVRSKGPSHNISILKFLQEFYKDKLEEDFLFILDKFRKKRHLAVYGIVEIVSEQECKFCMNLCKEFLLKVEGFVK